MFEYLENGEPCTLDDQCASELCGQGDVCESTYPTAVVLPPLPAFAPLVITEDYVWRHLGAGGVVGSNAAWHASLAEVRARPDALTVTIDVYNGQTTIWSAGGPLAAVAWRHRFRAVWLIGDLWKPAAIPTLHALAIEPIPTGNDAIGEEMIRQAAIAGLTANNAVAELQAIHNLNIPVSTYAAIGLARLGFPPPGIVEIPMPTADLTPLSSPPLGPPLEIPDLPLSQ